MKKFAIICIFLSVVLGSCKYEEGPFISVREAEARMVGVWELGKVYKNGIEQTETVTGLSANRPGSYYTFYYEGMLSVTAIVNGNIRESNQGFWNFQNNEKEIKVEFQLPGEDYLYEAEIKRLTMSELRYEYTDSDGNLWRFEMYTRSHY